jgi:DNA-directed RNA polymerase specialized sigma subunit
MKTTYLVWKDPACGGINPEWQEISGKAFYALVSTDEGRKRRFVRLFSTEPDGSDGEIVMEATAEEYRRWRKEKDHGDWVREGQDAVGYKVVSYHAMETGDGCFGEELLRDENGDVETECFKRLDAEDVRAALDLLSEEEQRMAAYFFLAAEPGSERDYAKLTGIPRKTINDRKNRLIAKLKKFLK